MRTATSFLIATTLLLAACKQDISDATYAAWGIGSSPQTQTMDVHNRAGTVVGAQHITITPRPPEDCKVTATLSGNFIDPDTGKSTPLPPGDITIDYHKATAITFEWLPLVVEAQYFNDPAHKPAWTPRNYLLTRIHGQDAVCEQGDKCHLQNEPVAIIADPSVTPELMLAAFNRVKAKCPSP